MVPAEPGCWVVAHRPVGEAQEAREEACERSCYPSGGFFGGLVDSAGADPGVLLLVMCGPPMGGGVESSSLFVRRG